MHRDVLKYVADEADHCASTKVLSFAVFSDLSDASVRELPADLNQRFLNVCSASTGNIPDPECGQAFSKSES